MTEVIPTISAQQALEWCQQDPEGTFLVDIRTIKAYNQTHIEGSYNLHTLYDIEHHFDYDDRILIMCYTGKSSIPFTHQLMINDFTNVYSVDGGFEECSQIGFPVVVNE